MPTDLILKKRDGFYSVPFVEDFGVRVAWTARKYDMAFGRASMSRLKAYTAMGFKPGAIVCPLQVHGDRAVVIGDKDRGRGVQDKSTAIPDTDALMTGTPGLAAAVLTADCLPLAIIEPAGRAIAVVHAGWRGLRDRIISKTIAQMHKRFSIDCSELIVILGPALRVCCYEVGEEFLGFFPDSLERRKQKLYLDMPAEALAQLRQSGVADSHVYDSRICTSCLNQEFFSYRREGASAGRSMFIVQTTA